MANAKTSTIAELLFSSPIETNFARMVGELDSLLERSQSLPRVLNWDYEDLATFDLPGVRFVLSLIEDTEVGTHPSLMISVGPSPIAATPGQTVPDFAAVCVRLVERIQGRFNLAAILWHQFDGVVTPDLLDALADVRPELPESIEPGQPVAFTFGDGADAERQLISSDTYQDQKVTHSARSCDRDPELARLRIALYPDGPELPAVSMRLTAKTMDASLMMVWMPCGEEEITYSVPQKAGNRFSLVA
jgi:hypothetical protein